MERAQGRLERVGVGPRRCRGLGWCIGTMARSCEKKKRGGEEGWCFSLGFAKRKEGEGEKDIIFK
jgi:hypothetical protein